MLYDIKNGQWRLEVATNKKANREYKDSVFTKLFSDKQKILELYNALECRNYPDDTEIKINTLDGVLYMDRMNDVSFILENKLIVLIEQQSSINGNMPLRCLIYICKLYEAFIASEKSNIYRETTVKIPRPEFICLYNGKEDFPDEKILKLSDAFSEIGENNRIDLDLSVRVLNINKGRNQTIVKESKVLSDYIIFIDIVRKYVEAGGSLAEALDEALKYSIEQGILAEFLKKYRAEVISMLATEFDLEVALEAAKLDGIVQGEIKGEKKKAIEVAKNALKEGASIDFISKIAGLDKSVIANLKVEMGR